VPRLSHWGADARVSLRQLSRAPARHYPPPCETCHSPVGWASVSLGPAAEALDLADHALPLDRGGADQDRGLSHPQGQPTVYTCFVCREPHRTRTLDTNAGIPGIFEKCTKCHP